MNETTTETTYPEVSTLPAIKPLADAALERLGLAVAVVERLKGYGKLVLADLTDKKAANDLDEKRKEVKRFRVAWENACKEGRSEANAIADAWVKAQNSLSADFKSTEAHLAKQVEAFENEQERLRKIAEEERLEKIRLRVESVVSVGAPLDMGLVNTLDDEAWGAYIEELQASAQILETATRQADELTALGDPATPAEVLQMEAHEIEHRLSVARKADHDRKEAARIQEEEEEAERQRVAAQEKAARVRLETGAQRMRDLAMLGSVVDLDAVADMTPDAFEVALATATQEKADRDAAAAKAAQEQRERDEELARMRQAEADRLEAERQAEEKRLQLEREQEDARRRAEEAEAEKARQEAERKAKEEREAEEARILEASRPEREKIAAWAKATIEELTKGTPEIADPQLSQMVTECIAGLVDDLGSLRAAVEDA